jgi:signal transduction histidine kinase
MPAHDPDSNPELTHSADSPAELENSLETELRNARHDLCNPISEILGFSDLLLEEVGHLAVFCPEESISARNLFATGTIASLISPALLEVKQNAARLLELVNESLISRRLRSEPGVLAQAQAEIDRLCLEIQSTCSGLLAHSSVQGQAGMQTGFRRLIHAAERLPGMAGRLFASILRLLDLGSPEPKNQSSGVTRPIAPPRANEVAIRSVRPL